MSDKSAIDSWETLKEKLKENLPNEYFVDRIDRSRKLRPEVCMIILREVVDPVLARSSDPERAELFVIKEKDEEIVRARINGEKFTSAERLTGLNLCRILNTTTETKWDIISPEYLYNEITGGLTAAINPDTIVYGAVGVEERETFSIKSRVIEGYTYTFEPYNLLNKEQHNALYETGTMIRVGVKEGGEEERGRGLYVHVNLEPPTKMVHFVRIEAPTQEMLLYVLYNILNTTSYFARSTRKGSIRNKILGVVFSKTGIGLSSGELIKEHFSANVKNEYTLSEVLTEVKKYVENHKNAFWKIIWHDETDFNKSISPVIDVALVKDEISKKILRECLVELTTQGKDAYSLQQKKQKVKS
jgi:CRISPR-associated protein Csc2